MVDFAAYFFGFLPLPILLRRVLPYRLGFAPKNATEDAIRSDHELRNPLASRLLQTLSRGELSAIAKRRPLRMGGSCLAVARKH
jgi:hypothetical protein